MIDVFKFIFMIYEKKGNKYWLEKFFLLFIKNGLERGLYDFEKSF